MKDSQKAAIKQAASNFTTAQLMFAIAHQCVTSSQNIIEDMSLDPEWMAENVVDRNLLIYNIDCAIDALVDIVADDQDQKFFENMPTTASLEGTLREMAKELVANFPELRKLKISV